MVFWQDMGLIVQAALWSPTTVVAVAMGVAVLVAIIMSIDSKIG